MPTARERLAELQEAVRVAARRVAELEAHRRTARRRIEAARSELRDYSRAVGAGRREADPDEERRMVEAVRAAEVGITVQPSLAGGRVFDFDFVDERAEGELEGAREALDRAQRAEAAFRAEHLAELAAERLEGARAVGRRLVEAAGALSIALNEWQREERELARFGIPREDVPPSPFADASAAEGIRHVDRALREDPDSLVPAPRWVTGAEA